MRTVDFNRKISTDIPEALITRYQYGERGEMQMCADPRFSVSAQEMNPDIRISFLPQIYCSALFIRSVSTAVNH